MRFLAALFFCGAIAGGSLLGSTVQADRHTPPRLFADYRVVHLQLEAPFHDLFASAHAHRDTDPAVDGALSYVDPDSGKQVRYGHVKVAVRGNTSRRDSECTFPKLKIDLGKDRPPAGSLFEGVQTVKVGTHCGERPDGELTKLGRWANQKSPIREAFVYRLLDAIGIRTLKARPAEISYVDDGRTTTRSALLLEDDADATARLGATGQLDTFENARASFSIDDAAAVAFAEAMIGNFDWAIKFSPDDFYRNDDENKLWNVLAMRRADGSAFPVIYDFDLAGPVTGSHPWFERVYFDGFLSTRSRPGIEVLSQVQHTRSLFDRDVLDRTRRRFRESRDAVYHTIEEATLDDGGRQFAREYLDSFFDAIADDRRFYRPVVVRTETLPFVASSGSEAACGNGDYTPIGTVIGEPVSREGTRVQVPLLDVSWHWASRCKAVHAGPVWMDVDSIGDNYPAR